MAESDDERLGRHLAAGSEEAFAELYDRFALRLYRVALAILNNSHDAEDAVQAVFVNLVHRRANLARVKNWAAYLLTVLRNEAARSGKRLRQQKADHPVEQIDQNSAPEERCRQDDLAWIETALQRLPDDQQKIVRLKTQAALTFAEIAELLQISPNTAASRYRYALDKLRRESMEDRDEAD